MSDMKQEYPLLRSAAHRLCRMAGVVGRCLDGDDVTQKTFERYYALGLDHRVDAAKGSALALLYAVLPYVFYESLRSENRHQRGRQELPPDSPCDDRACDSLETERAIKVEMGFNLPQGDPNAVTERQRVALRRTGGPLYGRAEDGEVLLADRSAACRARKKLRAFVLGLEQMDE